MRLERILLPLQDGTILTSRTSGVNTKKQTSLKTSLPHDRHKPDESSQIGLCEQVVSRFSMSRQLCTEFCGCQKNPRVTVDLMRFIMHSIVTKKRNATGRMAVDAGA